MKVKLAWSILVGFCVAVYTFMLHIVWLMSQQLGIVPALLVLAAITVLPAVSWAALTICEES